MKNLKNIILAIALVIGLILSVSEGSTFIPNLVGLVLFGCAGYALGIISTNNEEHYKD